MAVGKGRYLRSRFGKFLKARERGRYLRSRFGKFLMAV